MRCVDRQRLVEVLARLSAEGDHEEYRFLEYDIE